MDALPDSDDSLPPDVSQASQSSHELPPASDISNKRHKAAESTSDELPDDVPVPKSRFKRHAKCPYGSGCTHREFTLSPEAIEFASEHRNKLKELNKLDRKIAAARICLDVFFALFALS